jgi:hypothetical protein
MLNAVYYTNGDLQDHRMLNTELLVVFSEYAS